MTAHEAATSQPAWERRAEQGERWAPYALLAISVAISSARPEHEAADLLVLAGLGVLAAAWMAGMHTWAPPRRRDRPWHRIVYFAGLLAVAFVLMLGDPVYFIFAITGLLHAGSLRPRPLVFVGVAATSFAILYVTWGGLPGATVDELGGFVVLLVLQTVLIGFGHLGAEQLAARGEERRRMVERLEATLAENEGLHAQLLAQAHEAGVHDERERMAREIHDTLAQGLTGVVTQLEAADQGRHDPHVLGRHLDAAARLARESLAEARRSVQALRPGPLERGRLAGALERLVDEWAELTGVRAELSAADLPPSLPASVEVALLRVAQEALANVGKHASAQRVGMTLSCAGQTVILDVRDDGVGFDPGAERAGTFGLQSMRRRVEELGGTFVVESMPGAGTAVSATVPLPNPEPDHG